MRVDDFWLIDRGLYQRNCSRLDEANDPASYDVPGKRNEHGNNESRIELPMVMTSIPEHGAAFPQEKPTRSHRYVTVPKTPTYIVPLLQYPHCDLRRIFQIEYASRWPYPTLDILISFFNWKISPSSFVTRDKRIPKRHRSQFQRFSKSIRRIRVKDVEISESVLESFQTWKCQKSSKIRQTFSKL